MADGATSLSPDGLTIYIESFRLENRSRIYRATRPNLNSVFTTPSDDWFINVNNTPGTHNVGRGLISTDGLTLIYMASNQIFSATRSNTTLPFGPGTLVPNVNGIGDSPESTRPDWLSPDGLRLYMSVRTGGQNDMFVAERATSNSPFSTPSNSIFANLNSPFATEFEANLSADELQIFFTSDRPGGIGSFDIWWASRPDTMSVFGAPVNLTSINSLNRDRSPLLFGNTLFFASARASSIDDEQANDVYKVEIAPTVDTIIVTIDIKPGGTPNSINRRSNGNVPVALFSSSTFDARSADRRTVTIADAAPLNIGLGSKDVNNDGRLDVVFHFDTQALNLPDGTVKACLTGNTLTGQAFQGCDSVKLVK
jgi:hypothetical protein